MVIVLFGVAGSGKSTIGKLLADKLRWHFVDADDYHPPENVKKMSSGIPLNDEDRRVWLVEIRQLIESAEMHSQDTVLACSALKASYRKQFAVSSNIKFVLLEADFESIQERITKRKGHFMDPNLLDSQFEILELTNFIDLVVDSSLSPASCVAKIIRQFCASKT